MLLQVHFFCCLNCKSLSPCSSSSFLGPSKPRKPVNLSVPSKYALLLILDEQPSRIESNSFMCCWIRYRVDISFYMLFEEEIQPWGPRASLLVRVYTIHTDLLELCRFTLTLL